MYVFVKDMTWSNKMIRILPGVKWLNQAINPYEYLTFFGWSINGKIIRDACFFRPGFECGVYR